VNAILFVVLALVVGLATGKLIGAGLAFTHGRTRDDLIAGVVGAIIGAVPLHFFGPPGYREPLPALLIGLSAAMVATWSVRVFNWKKEPLRWSMDAIPEPIHDHHRHDMLTTSEGSRLLLSGGRLTLEEPDVAPQMPGAIS
jgi:uncharacterized membrane protein YeaQ/YmgE (transglycosylase-associated protein family)